jgi:glycosyltransferase involved in cell wall biosynthesis
MTVNLVFKGHWILERLATEIATRVPDVSLNASGWPPRHATDHDITYCLPGRNIRHFPDPPRGIRVGFFTHGDGYPARFAGEFHVTLAMNQRMAHLLRQAGARDVRVIRPGTDPPARPIVFGVCARSVEGKRPKGRKGLDLVEAAVAAGYSLVACSPDPQTVWPCPITHRTEDRAAFYRAIDYLLVTARDEGGPMVVPEAIAHGVPVIAPNVGWCWEYPVIRYERAWEALEPVLRGLARVDTWVEWAEAHRRLFVELARRAA